MKKKEKKNKFLAVWDPESFWKQIWNLLCLLFIIYQVFFVPYRIAFETGNETAWAAFEVIQDFFFIIDLLINFNMGEYEKGEKVMERKQAVIIYLKTWFLIDFVSSFPYDWAVNARISLEE